MSSIGEWVNRYREYGLCVLPLKGKVPWDFEENRELRWASFIARLPDNSEHYELFAHEGIEGLGVVCGPVSGNLLVVDWDDDDLYTDWALGHAEMCDTKKVQTGNGGHHLWYRLADGGNLTRRKFVWKGKPAGDAIYTGGQVVVPPSRHPDSGERYKWLTGKDIPIREIQNFAELGLEFQRPLKTQTGDNAAIPTGQRSDTLTSLAGTMRRRGMSADAVEAAIKAENQARCDPPLPERELERTVFQSARRWEQGSVVAPQEYHHTDMGNAGRFAVQHGQLVRYCYVWGKWLVWDGRRWEPDEMGRAEALAKETVRRIYAEASQADSKEERKKLSKHAIQTEAAYRIAMMLKLARSEEGVPIAIDSLDADPWLLNVENGTLDLKTLELRQHRQGDLITKLTPTPYLPDAEAPGWKKFLAEIFAGNQELIGYVQRGLGLSLTGSTREHVLFILYGIGSNGKTTLLETVRAVMGEDYAQRAPVQLLLKKRGETVPTDVARLRGARFVSAMEPERSKWLAEALVKALTGGDRLSARFMRQDYFEFDPTHKLWLGTNHKPVIRGTDHAIWRRIRLIPFTVVIPDEGQDKDLLEKLKGEAPGILAWIVEGLRKYHDGGLGVSEDVEAATLEYRTEMDIVGTFLSECCVEEAGTEAKASDLYKAYKRWCDDYGQRAISGTAFGREIGERGYEKKRTLEGNAYLGLGLADSIPWD